MVVPALAFFIGVGGGYPWLPFVAVSASLSCWSLVVVAVFASSGCCGGGERDTTVQPKSGSGSTDKSNITRTLHNSTKAHDSNSDQASFKACDTQSFRRSSQCQRPSPQAPHGHSAPPNGTATNVTACRGCYGLNTDELWRPTRTDNLGIKFLSSDVILQLGFHRK